MVTENDTERNTQINCADRMHSFIMLQRMVYIYEILVFKLLTGTQSY
jgi:hypothetical protein